MGLDNINKRIDDIQKKIDSLPDGREKEMAVFEKRCLADIVETVEKVKGSTIRADSSNADLEKLRRSYASLSYIDEARRSGENVSVEEIMEKSISVSQNDIYRKITHTAFRKSSRDGSSLYDLVPGEKKGYHLSGWIKELDNGGVPDYSASYDAFAAENGVNDAEMKKRYLELSKMNECIKGANRAFAKSPKELFDILTDKAELEKHEKAASVASFFKKQSDTVNAIRGLEPACGNYDGAPVCFVRQYSLFLEQDTSEAAMKRNQAKIDRFCSSDPEDADFKKEFVRDSLNRLLAIKDEDISVKTKEEKLAVCKKYGTLIDALFDADQNMIDNIGKDFYVPKPALNALKHKVDILTSNLSNVKKDFENDLDPHYAELKLLDGMDTENLSLVMDASNDDYCGTDDPNIKMLLSNKIINVNQSEREAADDASTHLDTNPEKFDGYFIMPDEMLTVKEPVKPRSPGGWASFVSGLTGLYNSTLGRIFGKAKDPYEAQFASYEKKKSAYESALAERAKGLENYKKDKEIYGDPVSKAAQEAIDVAAKNKRRPAVEAHEAFAAKREALTEAENKVDADIRFAKDTYKAILDSEFASLEHRSHGELNRLDHVMIGHKTLRAHLEEDFLAKNPGSEIYGADFSECLTYINDSVNNGNAEEIILAAQLDGKKVSIFKPDPKTGELVVNDRTGHFEHPLGIPEGIVFPKCKAVNELKEKFEAINKPSDASERLKMVPGCIDGVFKLNYIGRASLASQNSYNLKEQFFGSESTEGLDNPHKFSLTRSAMQSHVVAYLMTEKKMTIEQIADPDYMAKEKRDAGKLIKDIMTSENGDLDTLAKYNVNGIVKMKEYINGKLKNCDISDPKQLYSESNKYVFALSHFIVDLDQEQKNMRQSADRAIAEHISSTHPADLQKAVKGWNDEITSNTIFSGMNASYKALSRFKTGSITNAVQDRSLVIQQEIFKKSVSEKVRNGGSVFTALDGDAQITFQTSSYVATNYKKSDPVNTGIEEFIAGTDVRTPEKAAAFASYAASGDLIKDCNIENGNFAYAKTNANAQPVVNGDEVKRENDAPVI